MDLSEHFADSGEDIVISGISGRFPESDSFDELKENLLANKDLITEDSRRWPMGLYGLPTRSGKLKCLDKFDAQFFNLSGKQADYMDPQGRILLEVCYETIVDAGCNPATLRGSRTGVFIGAFLTEAEESLASDANRISGYGATGTKRNMLANRVSFVFDLKGPSLSIDTACSSSMVALQLAYSGMRANEFDSAIVGGVNVNLRPASALEFHKLNMLSIDGKCKFLDQSANGYARSETVSAILLQKRKYAKRVYATVLHVRTNSDGHKDQGITYPSLSAQADLMQMTIKEISLDPNWVRYIEAHGTGTAAGDQNELAAICKVYCKNRTDPLLVGSVKSNLGHSESSSGLCSIAKVIIAFETGKIPASLHLKTPNPMIPALIAGEILPITDNRNFEESVVAINSFGFGGTNVHMLLRPNHLPVDFQPKELYYFEIPRLIVVNGRTEESVRHILDWVACNKERATDYFFSMLNNVTNCETDGMYYHGYMIRDVAAEGFVERERKVAKVGDRRPVWFILSGMGTQWTGMAKGLMDIDIFNKSINASAEVLEPYGVDLLQLILGDNDELLAPIISSSIGIAAIQIALTDVMRALGITPDGFIGHSSGEMCCGYIDGVLDAREMLLFAYWRGKCVEQAKLPKGMMAAVGMSWEEIKMRCPPGVIPACHNASDSVTISGSYEEMEKFLIDLKAENVFTKKVNSCDIAFHSPYMRGVAVDMLKKLRSVSGAQRTRSKRWISTSVPESRWATPEGRFSTAEYYVNNLLSPVLFQEGLEMIPKNAIVVEISPDSLFKNVVKRSVGPECNYVGLMKRKNAPNNVSHLLTSIGELFNLGLKPKIENLYPRVEYPVRRGTQSLGSLIRWDHSEKYLVTLYPEYFNTKSHQETTIEIDFTKEQNKFYLDHIIDGRILFPATGYLWVVWDEFAKQSDTKWDQLAVIFENVRFLRATILNKDIILMFKLIISKINGDFQLYEANLLTVTGRIRVPTTDDRFLPLREKSIQLPSGGDSYRMERQNIYKELWIRGYHYGCEFQPLLSADLDQNRAKLKYSTQNWVQFSDALLHFVILKVSTRDLLLPTSIQAMHCDPRLMASLADQEVADIEMNLTGNYSLTKGLEIYGLGGSRAQRRNQSEELVLEKYLFLPYMDKNALQDDTRLVVEAYIELVSMLLITHSVHNQSVAEKTNRMNRLNSLLAINGITTDKLVFKDIIEMVDTSTVKGPVKHLLVTSDGRPLSADLLNNVYLGESLLRPAIDIVLENYSNVSSKELNVLEVNFNQEICYPKVMEYLKDSFYGFKTKYSVYNPSDVELNTDSDTNYEKIRVDFTPKPMASDGNRCHNLIVFREQFPTRDGTKGPEQEFVSHEEVLAYSYANLESNGFLVVLKRNDYTEPEKQLFSRFGYTYNQIPNVEQLILIADKIGFSLVSNRIDSDNTSSAVLLFRKVAKIADNASDKDIVIRITHTDYESWFEKLKNELDTPDPKDDKLIWLISDGENSSGIVGFVNCLRREPGGHRIRCISDLMFENLVYKSHSKSVSVRELIDSSIFDNRLVMNIYKKGELGSYRHLSLNPERLQKEPIRHAHIQVNKKRRTNSTLQWIESGHNLWPESRYNANDENILLTVFYAGLNPTSDSMDQSSDRTDSACPVRSGGDVKGLCSEFSGLDESGNGFFGIKPNGCLSTSLVFASRNDIIRVPEGWTLEQASTVPVAYGQAYLALVVKSQLQQGQSILINSIDGYVGRAALVICLAKECDIYGTVSSQEAKTALLTEFKDLDESKIINTSVECFKQAIVDKTIGKGVDIVFNYSDDYSIELSLFCLKQNGRLLEIGNRSTGLIRKALSTDKNITIDRINLEQIFNESSEQTSDETKHTVLRLIEEGISDGIVKPFRVQSVYPLAEVSTALDHISTNGHKHKVLIRLRDEDIPRDNDKTEEEVEVEVESESDVGKKLLKQELMIRAVHNTCFLKDRSYIITGGLGGFGLELAHWLVERGAHHLVLTTRSGIKNYFQEFNLDRLRSIGAQVVVSSLNVTNAEQCEQLLKEAELVAPVGAIFSLAMVLSDRMFKNQSQEGMESVLAPKVSALQNLDLISRDVCPELQYFVAFSSVSSGRGNAGQANYGYANSFMERTCELRRAEGLPALAIQWGAIADVGVVSEAFDSLSSTRAVGGTIPQRIHSCLSLLNHFLRAPDSVLGSFLRHEVKVQIVYQNPDIVRLISGILGIRDASKIRHMSKLTELGMDSLMVVEIKQALEKEFRLKLSLTELTNISFADLIKLVET